MPKTYTVKKDETLSGIGKQLGTDWKKITGYKSGNPNLIYPGEVLNIPGEESMAEKPIIPTASPTLPGLGGELATRALGAPVGEETPQDLITNQMTAALTKYANAPSLVEEKKRLEGEKGVLGLETQVGSFEDEVTKTQTLLSQLEEDITKRTGEYMVSESQRSRLYAAEQAPLLKSLDISQRGLTGATGRLERTKSDILTELGLIEKEKTAPLDLLEREVNIRSKIKDLTTKDIPNVVSSQFNDEGDMTIVTQDPTTGTFNTQTIRGIGEKANKYQDITSQVDDAGNVTIIGVSKDGKVVNLGTFKGIGKGAVGEAPLGVSIGSTEIRSAVNTLSAGQQDSGFAAIQTFKNAKDIVDLLNKGVSTGPISGLKLKGVKVFGAQIIPGTQAIGASSPEENQMIAATTAFTANFIKAISGAQVSDKEREFLMNALPTVSDQEQVIVDKLKTLMKTIKNKWELQLNLDFDQYPDDIPRIEDLKYIEGGSPENSAEGEIDFRF